MGGLILPQFWGYSPAWLQKSRGQCEAVGCDVSTVKSRQEWMLVPSSLLFDSLQDPSPVKESPSTWINLTWTVPHRHFQRLTESTQSLTGGFREKILSMCQPVQTITMTIIVNVQQKLWSQGWLFVCSYAWILTSTTWHGRHWLQQKHLRA